MRYARTCRVCSNATRTRGSDRRPEYPRQDCTSLAIERGYTQAVQLLLEHGADVNVRDEDGVLIDYSIIELKVCASEFGYVGSDSLLFGVIS
jgi:hypothetical protein